jgi:hypothetical protein
MGQFISLFELVAVASLCVILYVLIKTIVQTFKNK